ncbi:MAG: hypothetical protein ACFE95_03575 [Candidatus Hodarchaeota archaeon]
MKAKYIPVLLIVITIITITGPLLSVTPKQPYLKNSSIESQIAVLYIYGNYTTNHFFTYQSLFSSSLFISLSGINITDLMSNISFLSNYDVLIIGHSSFDTWDKSNSSHSNAILGAGLPILAMGQGGGTFFEGLGYSYGGSAMGFTSSGMIVNSSDASHGVFNQFYSFNVPGTITYTGTSFRGVLMSGHGSNANFLAVDQSFKNHSPLLENYAWSPQKTVYFGINGVPPNDQSNLYELIHNCLEWLSGTVFTTITEPPTTTETTMTSDQTSSTSSEPTMDPSEPTTSNPETPPPSDDSTSTAGSNETDTSTAETSTTNPILNITPGFSVFLIFCSLVFLVPLRRLMKKY